MHLYLIYCLNSLEDKLFANKIESIAGVGMKAISITSEQGSEFLDKVFPRGWKSRSYLVIVTQNKVSASTGYEMFLHLKILLGLQKGWQVYSLVQQYGVKSVNRGKKFSRKRSFTK